MNRLANKLAPTGEGLDAVDLMDPLANAMAPAAECSLLFFSRLSHQYFQ
jgi:hypothetical protein